MAKKGNIFDSAVQAREQEQEKLTAAVTGGSMSGKVTKTKITLSITQEDADTVKMYALKNHTTVSDLLHEWIQEKCDA